MKTVNLTIKKEDEPLLLEAPDIGVLFIEKLDNTKTQWTTTPENNAWHSMREGEDYLFAFAVYVRNIDSVESNFVVTMKA